MASPTCTVNATSTINGVNVSASSTVTVALADVADVSQWALSCTGTDDGNVAATISAGLSIDQVTKTATFTAPASAAALVFQSKVNNGQDINGRVEPSFTTTFGVFVVLANGLRLAADNETTEGDSVHGWTSKLNALGRTTVTLGGGNGSVLATIAGTDMP